MTDDFVTDSFLRALRESPDAAARRRALPAYKTDPLVWIAERGVKIESKDFGTIPFVPYAFQRPVITAVADWKSFVVEKSRQMGITTPIMVAYAHQLLYSQEVHGRPLRACVSAQKFDVAQDTILRIARVALDSATAEERGRLRGWDPDRHNPEVSYSTPEGRSFIRAYSSEPGSMRSFAGNAGLMEEVAFMPFARETYQSIAAMLTTRSMFQAVSTYICDGDYYCELVDDHAALGLELFSFDWRHVPERLYNCEDPDHPVFDNGVWWRAKEVAKLGEEGFGREHELQRGSPGELAVNMTLLKGFEDKVPFVGGGRRAEHRYAKGIDVAGPGDDSVAWVVIDRSIRPNQVVWLEQHPVLSSADTVERLIQFDMAWPGNTYIDGTFNPAIAAGLVHGVADRTGSSRHITAIRWRRGGLAPTKKFDPRDQLNWRNLSSLDMSTRLAYNLEHGRLICHRREWPQLFVALSTWRRDEPKRYRGRNLDLRDALILAGLDLTNLREGEHTESQFLSIEAPEQRPPQVYERRRDISGTFR